MKKNYCFALLILGMWQANALPLVNAHGAVATVAPPDCELVTPVSATATTGNAAAAIDGNSATRWESEAADPQSLTIDLGALSDVNAITIEWETANAKEYYLRGSVDGTNWVDIVYKTDMPAGQRTDIIEGINAQYQWLKIDGITRTTPYGYSIYEVNICSTAIVPPPVCNAITAAAAEASTGIATLAIDGNMASRWESEAADPQSLTVDLGITTMVHGVNISWETANAKEYYLRGSNDGENWTDIEHLTDMAPGPRTDAIFGIDAEYRWLRMDGVSRNTPYGYSIYEFEVCGEETTTPVEYIEIPALIQAEDFAAMSGVQTEATTDEGGGESVGYTDAGDYMDYNINVPANGTYTIALRVASAIDTGEIQLMIDGEALTIDNINVPNTGGWQVWQTISTSLALTEGNHVLRLLTVAAAYNINWIDITEGSTSGTQQFGKQNLSLYPNPAHGVINITALNTTTVNIYNQYGALVHKQYVSAGDTAVNISGLATGIYIVTADGHSTKLIVK
ncbi:discoidin domain-containing protein [Flavobacterium sp. RHBU_24]|uniref:discoidin domain-containing protein n=1 Tax=Flavobacterium sp. RHBU_24 TaxID=3391185 RepID=UPI00398498EA